jgi:site-specific DNA-methyltransferase (adenine-specific)
MIDLRNGDCIEVMKGMADNSVDSIVTDPPYELGFMGKSWDNTGIANNIDMWRECLRVLKPGGYLLSFSATRTYHRMASAIEDAGFEIRDMIEWVYGSGFPKSLNIGKAVDKLQGNERKEIGRNPNSRENCDKSNTLYESGTVGKTDILTKGTSEWEGWGTALKPAHEPICMARKPISEKTVAENCLKWGTGGINIDKSRVATTEDLSINGNRNNVKSHWGNSEGESKVEASPLGRFPANLIHDGSDEVVACFPESKSTANVRRNKSKTGVHGIYNEYEAQDSHGYADDGSAARFFKSILYYSKASKAERNKGVNNFHTTVKPVKLMEYLIEMVTPENGTVLDPFMGSGTTGVACVNLKRNFIGIELDKDYFEICKKRINNEVEKKQQTLF